MLVDSHCHLDYNDFEEDMDEIILRMKENGVTAALNAGNCIDLSLIHISEPTRP